MSQHDLTIDNAPGLDVRLDIQAALQAGATLQLAASAPASPYPAQLWADTSTGYLRMRNRANTGWVIVGKLDNDVLGILPLGGGSGQILAKASGNDFDTHWTDQAAGGDTAAVANNTVKAGPPTSGSAVPTYRALVIADLPAVLLRTDIAQGLNASAKKTMRADATGSALNLAPITNTAQVPTNAVDGDIWLDQTGSGRIRARVKGHDIRLNGFDFNTTQSITPNGYLEVPHGLGNIPTRKQVGLQCNVAEFGYNVGDFIPYLIGGNAQNNSGVGIACDTVNVRIKYGSASKPFQVISMDTGNLVQLTNANWYLVVRVAI